jgi:O-phosphoseryl-tRNA(Cys) synthetase
MLELLQGKKNLKAISKLLKAFHHVLLCTTKDFKPLHTCLNYSSHITHDWFVAHPSQVHAREPGPHLYSGKATWMQQEYNWFFVRIEPGNM